jgi:hypothetical protein
MRTITSVHWAPLFNFQSSIKSAELTDSLRLRRIQHNELLRVRREPHLGIEMLVDIIDASHVIEERQDAQRTRLLSEEPFNLVVTALRLLGTGDVGFNYVGSRLVFSEDKKVTSRRSDSAMFGGRKPPLGGQQYTYARGLGVKARRLIRQLQNGSSSSVKTAVDRFNFAYERKVRSHRLVDYWIALESLFLPANEAELRFRAALRIAYFLARTPDLRRQVYDNMRESYDLRSWIVHGESRSRRSKATWTPEVIDRVVTATEGYLRTSLQRCLLNVGEPRIDRLDDAIVRGSSYPLGDNT